MRTAVITAILLSLSNSIDARADDKPGLDELRWMLGRWTYATEKRTTTETWTDTRAGVFRGHGTVTTTAGNLPGREESLLLAEMSGEVFYIAKVPQNPLPVPFKLTAASSEHAIFENEKHDFPKRLEYRLGSNGQLTVTVGDGAKRSFTLRFTKADEQKPKQK